MKPVTHHTTQRQEARPPAPPRPGTPRPRDPRQRGSLLILCVTVLVIIALIGIAFLQRVRLDQAATARHERQYMDLVINGILAEIGQQMTDDIAENANNGRELYDYPWTKIVRNYNAELLNGTTVTVNGAGRNIGPGLFEATHEDDRWLASTAPVYNPNSPGGAAYHWLHLTNLTGIWLDIDAPTNAQQLIDRPGGDVFRSDTDIPIPALESTTGRTIPLGVDADMDGILDSRWQWVPTGVRDFAGRKYIMAVRIVDLSSMLNVNTATIGTVNGSTPYRDTMRGYAPTGADLSRLFSRVDYNNTQLIDNSGPPGDWFEEFEDLLDRRSLQNTSGALLPPSIPLPLSASQNLTLWEDQAAIYGNLDRNYLSDSEIELRRFGGINDPSNVAPLEEDLPKLLRQDPIFEQQRGTEASYVDLIDPANTPSINARISKWFYGANPSTADDPDTDSLLVKSREFPAIRHMLTTASGMGAYVTNYGGSASGGGRLKFDIKQQYTNTGELRERIEQAFRLPDPSTPSSNWYLGISDPRAQAQLIDEYVLAIQDYSDEDYIPTEGSGPLAPGLFGMEKLPFLREVYLHQLYEDENLLPAGGPPDNIFDTWVAKPDTQAVVVELGNPFASRIDALQLDGLIKVVVIQNGSEVSSWTFDNTVPDIDARDDSSAGDGDLLVLVSNQNGQAPADANGQGTGLDLENDLNISSATNLVTLNDGTLTFNTNDGDVIIELQVDVSPGGTGDWVTYDRMRTGLSFDTNIAHDPSPNDETNAARSQHRQASFWRDKQLINYVSVDTGNGSMTDSPDINFPNGDFKASSHNLLTDVSAGGGTWTPPPGFQLPIANEPMRSTAELAWVHMFGFTDTDAFSERLSLFPDNEHFLLIDPADSDFKVLQPPPVGAGISHAAVLMDVFTTVSPRDDGQDNDNNDGDDIIDRETSLVSTVEERSIDNTTEQFIPGTININTAPLHILTLGAPLAETVNEIEALMRMIVAYRDQPILAAAGYPDNLATPFEDTTGSPNIRELITTGPSVAIDRETKPGIGSIGELMFLNPYPPGATTAENNYNMHRYGRDGDLDLPNEMDLYPDPDDLNSKVVPLGDDNEQKLARFQMLGQTFSVRSDRFVVYAVVRGYDDITDLDDPTFGDPAETAQFIAVFDRGSMDVTPAGVANGLNKPRVIGYVRMQ